MIAASVARRLPQHREVTLAVIRAGRRCRISCGSSPAGLIAATVAGGCPDDRDATLAVIIGALHGERVIGLRIR